MPLYRYASYTLAPVLFGFNAACADQLPQAAPERGAQVFATYCTLCHGPSGKGDGRAAALQKIRPADLTRSTVDDGYRRQIIRYGGVSVARSESMPAWGVVLTGEQIENVIAYLKAHTPATPRQARADAQSPLNKSP